MHAARSRHYQYSSHYDTTSPTRQGLPSLLAGCPSHGGGSRGCQGDGGRGRRPAAAATAFSETRGAGGLFLRKKTRLAPIARRTYAGRARGDTGARGGGLSRPLSELYAAARHIATQAPAHTRKQAVKPNAVQCTMWRTVGQPAIGHTGF